MSTTVDYVYAEIRATPAGALLATLNNITDLRTNEMLDEAGQFSFLIPNTAVNPAVLKYWHCVKFYSKVGSEPGVYLGGGRITGIDDRWSGVKDTTLVTGFDHLIDLGELKVQYGEISELVWKTPLETQKVVYNAEEVTDLPLLRDGDTTVGVQGVSLVTPDGATVGSWLYVGHEAPFWMCKFYVKEPDGGFPWSNTVPGTMQVEPFDVNDWKWRNPTDGTAVGGIPFKQTGVVEWYRNDFEMQVTHDDKHLYWARFLVTPDGTSVFGLHEIEIAVAMPTNDDLDQLLAYAAGWSVENLHLHTGKTAFSIRGESVLLLLRRIAEHTQEHFRLNGYGLITWLGKSTSFVSSGITAVQEPAAGHASSPEDWCYFKSLRRKQDYSQVITRINPLGNGEDGAQVNLSQVNLAEIDLPPGYAIDEINNWVINTALEAELGVQKPAYRTYPEVAPLSGGVNTTVAESNMLATAAIAELTRHESEGKYYELSEVVGLTGSLKVGQKMVIYHQPLNQDGTVKETINETVVVTAIERRYGRDGRLTVNLEISTVAQHAPTPERLALRKQRDAQVRNLHPKPIRVDKLAGDAAGGLRGGVSGATGDLAAHIADTEAHNIPAQITTEISEHSALPDAHHAKQHALSDATAHTGLLPWGWLDKATSSLADLANKAISLTTGNLEWSRVDKTGSSLAHLVTRLYSDLQSRVHSLVGSDHSISGSDGDLVGNVGGSPGLHTPVSDVKATPGRVVKADGNGDIALRRLAADKITVLEFGSSLIPDTVDTWDIGSPIKLWRSGYLSELSAILFKEEVVSAVGGYVLIPHLQGTLLADVGSGDTVINFGNLALEVNDFILMRGLGSGGLPQMEYMQVVGRATTTTSPAVGSNDSGAWEVAGTPALSPVSVFGTSSEWLGVRFALNVPQGATITSAYLKITSNGGWGGGAGSATVYGHDTDDSSAFNAGLENNLSDRPLTSANVAWSTGAAWTNNVVYSSPDIKTVLQEIVDRGGWAAGNYLSLLVRGSGAGSTNRPIYDYETAPAKAPVLEVTYQLPNGWNVTRNVDGSGANSWPEGHVFVVLGYDGDGRIELDAQTTGASPRISVFTQGTTYNAQTERVRLGNLRSWGPFVADAYGIAIGDYAGNKYLYYEPVNGLVISGNIKIQGNSEFKGVVTIDTAGEIRQGSGTLGSTFTGLRLFNSGGVGVLETRNNNVVQVQLDTNGNFLAGEGKLKVNASGLEITAGTTSPSQITFKSSTDSTVTGYIGENDTGTSVKMNVFAKGKSTNKAGEINIRAEEGETATTHAEINLLGKFSGNSVIQAKVDNVTRLLLNSNSSASAPMQAYDKNSNLVTLVPDDFGWKAPSYVNSWVNYGGGFQDGRYRKEPGNVVRLEGLVKSGSATTIFTLPAGYRPAATVTFTVMGYDNVLVRINVTSAGVVQIVGSYSNTWVSLTGIAFAVA